VIGLPKVRKPVKYYSPKRRAIYAQGDEIIALVVFEMHAWTCSICGNKIDRRLRLPNYMAATIEHVRPLAHGGTHTWDNVRPAHAKCNFQKGDTDITLVASESEVSYT